MPAISLAKSVSLPERRGIGQAIADRLAANGSLVVFTDIGEAGAGGSKSNRRSSWLSPGRNQS